MDIHVNTRDIKLTFGEWLDDQLVAAGYNQTTFAEAIGVAQSAVNQWVNNVQPPSRRNVARIARALNMAASDIEARIDRRRRGGLHAATAVRVARNVATFRVHGVVPADAFRWADSGGECGEVDVPLSWLQGRDQREFFVVEVSGDCLSSLGIGDGAYLFCQRATRLPRDGDLVIVRIGDEVTCKRWRWAGGRVELVDGDERVVYSCDPRSSELHVEGYVIAEIQPHGSVHT
jgi:SOS-response transcriptional repressor LexA